MENTKFLKRELYFYRFFLSFFFLYSNLFIYIGIFLDHPI